MKRNILKTVVVLLMFSTAIRAQETINFSTDQITTPNVLPPNVSSFQKVNFLPVSNYTGRANIDIPFYDIDLGGLKIPIKLKYNTGGIKVNDVASSVGLGWSLSSGGMISKVVKDVDDFKNGCTQSYDWETHMTYYYGPFGWLSYYTKHSAPYMTELIGGDSMPDVFNVSAPDVAFSFIHNRAAYTTDFGSQPTTLPEISGYDENGQYFNITDSNPIDGKPFILDSDDSYTITEEYGWIETGQWGGEICYTYGSQGNGYSEFWDNFNTFNSQAAYYGIKSIKIKSINGYEYIFDKIDSSQFLYDRDKSHFLAHTYTSDVNVMSYNLSKIIDLKTGKFVEFQYESYNQPFSEIIDNNGVRIDPETYVDPLNPNSYEQVGVWSRNPKLNRIKKIIFDKGYLNFNYDLTREDIPGEKGLTNIILFDNKGNQIRKMNLNFEYFQSNIAPTSPFSKRLKLKDVVITGNSSTIQNKYSLSYNQTTLPLRVNAISDFFGYNNGQHLNFTYNLGNGDYINNPPSYNVKPNPISFFHPNKKENTFLPSSLSSNTVLLQGNYSLVSNLSFCKAGILEKIEYATGGYISLDYELNRFIINGTEIEGGGLRVKKQIISDGTNSRTLNFEYKNLDNTSSGTIANMPKWIDFSYLGPNTANLPENTTAQQFNDWFSLVKYNYNKSNVELTEGAYVGYSRVKVYEENNGYSVYHYTSPKDYPNTSSKFVYTMPNYSPSYTAWNNSRKVHFNNGKTDLYFGNDILRGKLLKASIFNQQNQLLKETLYQYSETNYKNFLTVKKINVGMPNEINPDFQFTEQYGLQKKRRNLLTSVVEKEYFNGTVKTKTKSHVYDDNYSLIKTENITDDLNTYRNEYYYPYNTNFQGDFGMSNLISSNRKAEKILTYNFKNNEKLLEEKVLYNSFGSLTLPKQAKKYKSGSSGNTSEIKSAEATIRDEFGNICEITDVLGNKTSFIWGYNKTEIVAKIENVGYGTIQSSVITAIQNASNTGTENDLLNQLNNLRSTLSSTPNALISTYTYKPLIGVSTITDIRQDKITYEYEDFGRLKSVRDKNNNIISENEYNIKPQN